MKKQLITLIILQTLALATAAAISYWIYTGLMELTSDMNISGITAGTLMIFLSIILVSMATVYRADRKSSALLAIAVLVLACMSCSGQKTLTGRQTVAKEQQENQFRGFRLDHLD